MQLSHSQSASALALGVQPSGTTPKAQFDIIWNTTLVCPWDCAICCVDAIHVVGDSGKVKLRSQGLSKVELIEQGPSESRFDAALRHLQTHARELTWEKKLSVLDNLAGQSVRLDISGGDALTVHEGQDLLHEACRRLGRNNLTLTVTGAGLRKRDIPSVADSIGEFNFTYDPGSSDRADLRPQGYAASNLQLATAMSRLGVSVRAEMPLTRFAIDKKILEKSYRALADAGVQKLLIMRLFAVGRGLVNKDAIPTHAEYLQAINILKNCEQRLNGPKIKLQCALRHIVADANNLDPEARNPCDLVTESFGLMADGTLLASPWAVGATGAPLDPCFVLGNLSNTPFAELRSGTSAMEMHQRANENYGHCKIFAFQHSHLSRPLDRIFDKADPLFIDPNCEPAKKYRPIQTMFIDDVGGAA